MKRLLLCISFWGIVLASFASHPVVRNFTRKEYKSGTQNWAITQDEKNMMYFGNNNGMLVFDGKNWLTVPIINGTSVRALLYAGNGRFYASTFNHFGYFEKEKNGKFGYISLTNKFGIIPDSPNELYNIHQFKDKIYFQGERSVYIFDGKNISKVAYKHKIDVSAVIHEVFFVADSESGLSMLNGSMFVRVPGSELLIDKKVCSILPYGENNVLIVTSFNGVYVYDGFSITPFNTGADGFLRSNQVFCAVTNGKQIVYGTVQRGIAIQDIVEKTVTYVNSFLGLQNNTVLSAAFDNQQNLWLGLDKGIDYVLLNSSVLNLFGANNLYGAGYTSFRKDNTLYLGTNQGLYASAYPLPNSPLPLQLRLIPGMEGQVWSLTEIDNTLFCGDDQGAFIIYPDRVEQVNGLSGTWSFRQLKKHPDMILGCSYNGLFVLKKTGKRWALSHFLKGDFKESSPMFEEDPDGSVWFSHWQKGLFRLYLNPAVDSIVRVGLYNETKGLPSNQNNTLFRVDDEIVFSSEQGLYLYNRKTDRMEPYEKWNRLFASLPSYMRLHESINGDVWCVSGKFLGLARKQGDAYVMDSLSYRILQPKIITGFENFNFIDDKNLILSTEDGFSWINTRVPVKSESHFKVLLNSVIATNSNSSTERHLFGNISSGEQFEHERNSLRFEFVAPEYRNEGLVEYSYFLENYDKTWSDFSYDNIKEYNKLPSGEYHFKVKARNRLESDEALLVYSFTILPAWYESRLAFAIYIFLGALLIAGLIFFVSYQSRKGAVEMEKKKEIEIQEQKKQYEADAQAKKREIKELKNQQLQYELRHKSQELASSTMNLIRKNEILLDIVNNISKTTDEIRRNADKDSLLSRLGKMERNIRENIENDDNWKRFEENFDLVYESYLKRLGDTFPELTVSDKKICAYIKMDLSSKDMAPLMNLSVRSIETNRYRIRKKLELDRNVNLTEFLQKF